MPENTKRFAKKRKESRSFKQFRQLLQLIIYCYKKILANENYDQEDIEKNRTPHLEDYLKYSLIEYMRKHKKRFPILANTRIIAEEGRYDKEKDKESKSDISVHNIHPGTVLDTQTDYTDEAFHYTFECKRLDHKKKNPLYITEGIKRFVTNSYAAAMPRAGMIGFVEAGDIETIKKDINRRLRDISQKDKFLTTRFLQFFSVEENFKYSYFSRHHRIENSQIDLYHLMLDYSAILYKKTHENL